jgi:hypothetical protein
MSDLITTVKHDAGENQTHLVDSQDVRPYLEENARRREIAPRGDFHHKWQAPNIMITKWYFEYTGGQFGGAYKPMNQEFYEWVDKKIMSDPDLKAFRTAGYNFKRGYSR